MRVNRMNQKIKYFALEFAIDDGSEKTSTMCVLGYRQPTFEEAEEFLKEDCTRYGDEKLNAIYEVTSERAHDEFDMEAEATFPVFGTERKTCIGIVFENAVAGYKSFEAEMLMLSKKEIFDKAYEINARNEISGYLCDCAEADLDGQEIKVLADLGGAIIDVLYEYFQNVDNASIMFYEDIKEWIEDFCEEAMKNEI